MSGPIGSLGLYRPGDSPLHRCPAGPKLAGLLLLGILAGLAPIWPSAQLWIGLGMLAVGIAVWVLAGLPWRLLVRLLPAVAVLLSALAVVQWWSNGGPMAVGTVTRLLGLLLTAWTVTATTRVSAMLQVMLRLLSPLQRLGVPTGRIALAVALTVRAIPLIADGVRRAREARSARGAPDGLRGLPGLSVATLVHTVRISDAMAEALIARGGPDR